MNKQYITEVSRERAAKTFLKQTGKNPAEHPEEFEAFRKDLNKQVNNAYTGKVDNSAKIGDVAQELVRIYETDNGNFVPRLNDALQKLRNKDATVMIQMVRENLDMTTVEDELLGLLVARLSSTRSESTEILLAVLHESMTNPSGCKYPWLKTLINQQLVTEEDFDIDALNIPSTSGTTLNSPEDTGGAEEFTTDSPAGDSEFNLDDMAGGDNTPHISPSGGYSPAGMEDMGDEEGVSDYVAPQPTMRVIDMIFDDENPINTKVKIQNVDTGEVEIKNLYEVDV